MYEGAARGSGILLCIGLSASMLDARLRLMGLHSAGLLTIALELVAFLRPAGILCGLLPGEASWPFVQKATPHR